MGQDCTKQPVFRIDKIKIWAGWDKLMAQKKRDSANYSYADDLGGLALLDANYHHQRFSRHVHEGFCIGVIDVGAQRFFREGSNHLAPQNSIILVNADQVHDGHCASDNGWSYRAIYPTAEMLATISDELQGPSSGVPWFTEPVVYDPHMANRLRQFFDLLQHSGNSLERQTHFLDVMTELVQRHGGNGSYLPTIERQPLAVHRVREYIDNNIDKNISLQELSMLVDLTPHYLTRLFQRHAGAPPHAYQLMMRIQRAKKLIRLGVSLADVAADTGFTDQSHLHRHFKKMMGVTPGRYLKAIL